MLDIGQTISQYIRELSLLAVPLLLALTFHELAHGAVAYALGDPTAKRAGRLTMNPIRHLDPMGTLVFVVTRMIGWAKPVPVDPRYFRNPAKGMVLVSVAGPLSNFLQAAVFAFILGRMALIRIGPEDEMLLKVLEPLMNMAAIAVTVNLALGFFNLLPIPPLDGSNIVAGLLPREVAARYMAIGRYGIFIIVLLALTGLFGRVLWPLITGSRHLLGQLFMPPGIF